MTAPLQVRLEVLGVALGRLATEGGHEQAAWAQTRVGMVQMVTDALAGILAEVEEKVGAEEGRAERREKLAAAPEPEPAPEPGGS